MLIVKIAPSPPNHLQNNVFFLEVIFFIKYNLFILKNEIDQINFVESLF